MQHAQGTRSRLSTQRRNAAGQRIGNHHGKGDNCYDDRNRLYAQPRHTPRSIRRRVRTIGRMVATHHRQPSS